MAVGADNPNIAGLARADRRTEILAARKRASQQSELTELSALVDDLIVLINRLVPTGTFVMGGWDTDPIGFLILDGSTVTGGTLIYPQLAAMFPSWVSGSDLVLPNMDGKTFIGNDATPGVTGGSMTHTLSTANLPSHRHSTSHTHSVDPPSAWGSVYYIGGVYGGGGTQYLLRGSGPGRVAFNFPAVTSGGASNVWSSYVGSGSAVDHTPANMTVRVAVKT